MQEENVRLTGGEMARWVILAAVLVACVAAYFALSPRVPPVVRATATAEAQ